MKKIIVAGLGLLVLNLGGCSQDKPQEVKEEIKEEIKENTLSRVRFDENEEDLLNLLGLFYEVWVYEYQLPQEVKTIQIDFMHLIDGEWVEVESGSYDAFDQLDGKIAIRMNADETITCMIQNNFESELVTKKFKLMPPSETYLKKTHSFLEGKETIEIGKPLTLGILCYSNEGTLHTYAPDKYDNVELFEDADFAQAIRVTFLPEE